ncbi:unnamed protein product [Protopolystoma xenopodis]|uniref:Uncharacterized protein n=1 Tax=Protopolystoma xenopodis TaxID=117903 RepID=A0A3S5B2J2_9PLAT|nr:unnamed protein product [Protopolystoma xenopodis]
MSSGFQRTEISRIPSSTSTRGIGCRQRLAKLFRHPRPLSTRTCSRVVHEPRPFKVAGPDTSCLKRQLSP